MHIPRLYDTLLRSLLATHPQMALVSGPRQVGTTTSAQALAAPGGDLNWDDLDHRRILLAGPAAVAEAVGLHSLADRSSRTRRTNSCWRLRSTAEPMHW